MMTRAMCVAIAAAAMGAGASDPAAVVEELLKSPRPSRHFSSEDNAIRQAEWDMLAALIAANPADYETVLASYLTLPTELPMFSERVSAMGRPGGISDDSVAVLRLLTLLGQERAERQLARFVRSATPLAADAEASTDAMVRQLRELDGDARSGNLSLRAKEMYAVQNTLQFYIANVFQIAAQSSYGGLVDEAFDTIQTDRSVSATRSDEALKYLSELRASHPEIRAKAILAQQSRPVEFVSTAQKLIWDELAKLAQ